MDEGEPVGLDTQAQLVLVVLLAGPAAVARQVGARAALAQPPFGRAPLGVA